MTATDLCVHLEFECECEVGRFEDTGTFRLDVKVHCIRCGEPFRFLEVGPGILLKGPCVNIDGTQLSVPIEPEGEKRLFNNIPIYMPKLPEQA